MSVLEGGTRHALAGGTFIGSNPYDIDDSYGPSAVVPGPIGLLLNIAKLTNTFAGPEAYGLYLNSQPSNVDARLDYSQSPQGTLLTQLAVHNTSGEPIKSSVLVTGTHGTTVQSDSQWLLSDQTTGFLSELGEVNVPVFLPPDEGAEVRVWVVVGSTNPPLLRTIDFRVPSSEEAEVALPHGH